MANFYWDSFKTFFKIGAFTIGGGYAMIPLIEEEVVTRRQWIAKEEFVDLLAIAQSCPGVFAINMSVFIGYKLRKVRGALCTALGTALPSFIIILAIAMCFRHFMDVPWVAAMFMGIRPAVDLKDHRVGPSSIRHRDPAGARPAPVARARRVPRDRQEGIEEGRPVRR